MKCIDIQAMYLPEVGEQAMFVVWETDGGTYEATINVGEKTLSAGEWETLDLCYDWGTEYFAKNYGVSI
jgi:hypothetical protein